MGVSGWLMFAPVARAQVRPYIGFVYPAGGQQGTTFKIRLGGQGLEDVNRVFVTGSGVTARLLEYDRLLNPQEVTLLNEQLKELKRGKPAGASMMMNSGAPMMASESPMMTSGTTTQKTATARAGRDEPSLKLAARIEKRVAEFVSRPASVSLASIAYVEVTISGDAQAGERELRLGTLRGISNPLVFHVGQLPEVSRKPMTTTTLQVLGKEELALRKRPATEVEERITLPCTVNGQIASGELNRYRFAGRKGQRLVITTQARSLIPYIADAVPGWFQPVLTLYDANGKEVAYDDDYRFKPDPTILYQVPSDGEYALVIYDAIYRGREDFVYRITLGEVPFVTSLFPLGGRAGTAPVIKMKGWNLGKAQGRTKLPGPRAVPARSAQEHARALGKPERQGAIEAAASRDGSRSDPMFDAALEQAELTLPARDAEPGIHRLTTSRQGFISNPLPFALDMLPEAFEKEPNDTLAQAQKVKLPIIINGRMDRPGDWDVFQFAGNANETVVAEVYARRLDSPLDSVLKLTDAKGKLLAFNDDCEDLAAGVNTHHADSYLMARLPADGTYYVHLGDAARNAGEEYAYRLRISAPQPDFALRVVPSSISLRSKSSAPLSVYVIRKDGFNGPIKLSLTNPPTGFSAFPISLSGTQAMVRLTLKTTLITTEEPINLSVMGSAKIEGKDVTREAVPAEDRMQAFLWRHLVPASDLKVLVFDPNYQPTPKRVAPTRQPTEVETKPTVASADSETNKPKFTKQQVAGLLRQLKRLYEDDLLTDAFYDQKIAECEAAR